MRNVLVHDDLSNWVLDVNVLVNAYIAQTPSQQQCKTWLEASLQTPSMVLWLPTATKLGFVRLLGSGIVTQKPELFALLHDYLDTLAKHGVKEATPGANHATFWRIATGLIQTKGNDITDSHMVATALELNASLVTCDKGFGRFTESMGLKLFNPTL
jgi:predicted nucleic acid-binding protein